QFDQGLSALMIAGYSLTRLFLGSRSTAAMALIAFAWLWHRTVRPFPRTALIGSGVTMVFVVFPVVGAMRNASGSERAALSSLSRAYISVQRNPAIASLSEMGNSMRTIAYTLDLVPVARPFDLGVGYGYAALTIFPNVFWRVHPTVA